MFFVLRGETFSEKKFPLALPFKKLLSIFSLNFQRVCSVRTDQESMWGPSPTNAVQIVRGTGSPYARFLRFTSLGRAKEVNKKLLQSERFVRPFFSRKTFFKILQLFFKNPLTNPQLSCIICPVIQRQQVSVKACRSPAEEDVNLTHRVYYVLSSRRALALTEKVFFFL